MKPSFIEKIKTLFAQIRKTISGVASKGEVASGPKVSIADSIASGGGASSVALVRSKIIARPVFEWTYIYLLIAILGFMSADLTILSIRDMMLPTSAPPARPTPLAPVISKLRTQYNTVTSRNIFNSDGLIPPPLSQPNGKGNHNLDGPAVPTSLPLALVGTIVHKNPAKSMATIEIKSGTPKILPYVVNDEIESFGTLLRVDRKRAIFRNNQTGRNEYVEIKDNTGVSFGMRSEKTSAAEPSGPTDFSLPRSEVNNYIRNLPELLQQARAEPNILPGSGGKIDGFKILDIMPGSIYEKLGIRVGDVIKGVNGETVDSPAKAMELYQSLRNSNRISIEVERNGSKENLNYNIN